MAITFGFFHDSALTNPIESVDPLTATQDTGGSLGPVDKVIYFGSPTAGRVAKASSNPGVDSIVVSIADANAGTGAPATEFKLALSSGALATATAGASLTLSTSVTSGVANAVPIYTRRTSALTTVGTYTDIILTTNQLREEPA